MKEKSNNDKKGGNKPASKSKGGKKNNAKLDSRFASIATDPKFLSAPKSVTKVKIDKRFNKMMKDKDFMTSAVKDKLGKFTIGLLKMAYQHVVHGFWS
jgi:hypothetical protein